MLRACGKYCFCAFHSCELRAYLFSRFLGFFVMQYKYRELGGVWDGRRLLALEKNELSDLAFEYELNGRGSVSAFLQ